MNRRNTAAELSLLYRLRWELRQLFRGRQSGASFIEYLLIAGIIALGAIVSFRRLRAAGDNTSGRQGQAVRTLNNVNAGNGGPGFPGLGTPNPNFPGLGNTPGGNVPIIGIGPGGRKGLPVIQPSKCFGAGTPVLTDSGERPIEAVVPGDFVWSRDEATGADVLSRVTRTFTTPDQLVIGVHVPWDVGKSELISVTPGHPFWVDGAGWVAAQDLDGARLSSPSGYTFGTALESSGERATVYNLEVEGQHTYFVGHSHVLVHNTCKYAPQSYNDWKNDPTKPPNTQVNHVNQNAVYGTSKGGKIPYGEGVAVPLTGSVSDRLDHYKFHRSLEDFWDKYRTGGANAGEFPTNAEYGAAVEAALIAANIPATDALNIAEAARRQRIKYGYNDEDDVPRIPGAFLKKNPVTGVEEEDPDND